MRCEAGCCHITVPQPPLLVNAMTCFWDWLAHPERAGPCNPRAPAGSEAPKIGVLQSSSGRGASFSPDTIRGQILRPSVCPDTAPAARSLFVDHDDRTQLTPIDVPMPRRFSSSTLRGMWAM
jgi:hypothetical protein